MLLPFKRLYQAYAHMPTFTVKWTLTQAKAQVRVHMHWERSCVLFEPPLPVLGR